MGARFDGLPPHLQDVVREQIRKNARRIQEEARQQMPRSHQTTDFRTAPRLPARSYVDAGETVHVITTLAAR